MAPPPFLARCGDSSPLFELKSAIEGDSAPIVVNTTVLCPKDPLKITKENTRQFDLYTLYHKGIGNFFYDKKEGVDGKVA